MRPFLGSSEKWLRRLTPRLRERSYRHRNVTSRRRKGRRLRGESLEQRQLLAADATGFRHNVFDAEDVNDDGEISAVDALMIINAMDGQGRGDIVGFTDVNNDGRRSALDALRVINRMQRELSGNLVRNETPRDRDRGGAALPDFPDELRSFDGSGNNLADPALGSAGQAFIRIADADYGDGISTPAGSDRPSAREISNALSDVDGSGIKNERGLSAFIYVWGQFIDHDLDLTQSDENGEAFDIVVPTGDPLFDPDGDGQSVIPLTRSAIDPATGTSIDNPAEQINAITPFIDGSQVYGSDQVTADSLRTFEGGRLTLTEDGLIPMDETGMVIAGDLRASENIALTAMQTLFVREHNRLADKIAAETPEATDEDIYQQARAIVIAEIQSITYNEFLPALLGRDAIDPYQGYDASVDPRIATEFSTAAFRFGHSTLNDDIEFFDNEGRAIRDEIELKDAFFNAGLLEETGIDSVLKYDASSQAQEIDLQVVDSLRNFLFGPPGAGGLDLAALNIQRGRDHGLSDYNSTRVAYGLDAVESFDQVTSDVELQEKLAELYGDVHKIDLWVGLMAEDHLPGASVGALTSTIIADQFERVRDGDRFYYQNQFSDSEVRTIDRTSLADIIERNTDVQGLQDNVFFMQAEVRGRVTAATTTVAARSRQPDGNRPADLRGIPGITVELLDDSGTVIDSTVTDRRGNYRFRSFTETGDYQVRLGETGEAIDILIANGASRIRGLNFAVVV